MNPIQLLTATTIAGNITNINKHHILAINSPDNECWITVTTTSGHRIELHPDTDYDQLIHNWTA